jgi:hypothetical protein
MWFTSAALVVIAASGAADPPQAPPEPAVPGEPRVEQRVSEDDQVRVEELRVRGESRRIVVKPKAPGAREYEIVPSSGAVDPSQTYRRPPGASVWRLLSF